MAKIGLPKGSGKRLKVREKSVKSQGILKWILSGNPATAINRDWIHNQACRLSHDIHAASHSFLTFCNHVDGLLYSVFLVPFDYFCSIALPHGVMGWSVVSNTSADPEGGGQGVRTPPGKLQVKWVSIRNKQLDPPPWKMLDPSGSLKNDRFL